MTTWYRVHHSDNKKEVFSGAGGDYTAGRWNKPGTKAVYCSESIALCTLEWLANQGLLVSAFNYYRYSIEIPESSIIRFSLKQLPKNWRATPATEITRDFAEKYLFSDQRKLAIVVPSVVIPEEYNLVINPLHDSFTQAAKTIKSLGVYCAPVRK